MSFRKYYHVKHLIEHDVKHWKYVKYRSFKMIDKCTDYKSMRMWTSNHSQLSMYENQWSIYELFRCDELFFFKENPNTWYSIKIDTNQHPKFPKTVSEYVYRGLMIRQAIEVILL